MKSTTGWKAPNTDATNSSGFSGLPSGGRGSSGAFNTIDGGVGLWWSSTEGGGSSGVLYGLARALDYDDGDVNLNAGLRVNGYSVRCIKD
jgi:uncharacterized protein (TIGR02145 family)